MDAFKLENLTFTYSGADAPALKEVSLSIGEGEFFVLCGLSGSGKSTLLRLMKPALSPAGSLEGERTFFGSPLSDLPAREDAAEIGFILQSVEEQIVTDKVWHELAFGLESMGLPTAVIRRRVAETASFFGIEDWFYKNTAELSGGQKLLLSLASVMVMQPRVLILDEPTAQLDPVAAESFISALRRTNTELGTTVIISEHRLEETLPAATRAAVLDGGKLAAVGTPAEIGRTLMERNHPMLAAMPVSVRVWASLGGAGECPVSIRDGRAWLKSVISSETEMSRHEAPRRGGVADAALVARDLHFKYEGGDVEILRGLDIEVCRGEIYALLGGNGAGKSTLLRLASGLEKPRYGELEVHGRTGLLPQDPRVLFIKKTVGEELADAQSTPDGDELAGVAALCGVGELMERHPYDLSGGEQQRAALAKILLTKPDILLLDEPTKGMDGDAKLRLAHFLLDFVQGGGAVLMVSHDVEFCAGCADRCGLLFDGAISAEGEPEEFFEGNSYYTTAASRLTRDILPCAVTAGDVIGALGGKTEEYAGITRETRAVPIGRTPAIKPLPVWRRVIAGAALAAVFVIMVISAGRTDLSALIGAEGTSAAGRGVLGLYCAAILALAVFAAAVFRRRGTARRTARRGFGAASVAAALMILVLVPLTVWVGTRFFGGRKYYFISLLIILEVILAFAVSFEGRRPRAREIVTISSLCALGVAGRAVFFMLPEFKPVLALTVAAGAALGAESGFLVGSVTMLVSNMLFSQGPWTPWQMAAMGLAGFIAGIVFGFLRPSRVALSVFGFLASVIIYGGIMNPASALIWSGELNREILMTYYITGFPIDLVRGVATALVLWLMGNEILDKLERMKVKYGIFGG